ncbi:hypothetical protein AAKU55_003131 [Oxalobacteraceae bacterium GrIS 1.11]
MKRAKHANLRNFASWTIAALLSGCAGAPVLATQAVNMPVYVSCVKSAPTRPDFEFGKLGLAASDGERVLALARDWPRGRKYEGELEAVIEGCNLSRTSPPTSQQ